MENQALATECSKPSTQAFERESNYVGMDRALRLERDKNWTHGIGI